MNELLRHSLIEGEQVGSRYALAVPRNVPMGLMGMQLGNRAGSSLEFKDHRDYQLGDDLRRIDWSAYARSDKLTVKLYREEINPHVDIIIDGSASMALTNTTKDQATCAIAAICATAAANARYSHATYLAQSGCSPVAQGNQNPSVWDHITFEGEVPVHEALRALPPRWRTRGIRILISDLLWLGNPNDVLDPLSNGASAVYIIQLLAQADAEPPQRGNVRLVDSETGELKEVFIDAAAQKRYKNDLAAHQQNWHRACRGVGATMNTLIAEPMLDEWELTNLIESEVLTPSS